MMTENKELGISNQMDHQKLTEMNNKLNANNPDDGEKAFDKSGIDPA